MVVGGGPTGVEMAGQIGELARDTLRREFRSIDPAEARVLLVETLDRLLTSFPPKLSAKAARSLEHLGVTPLLGHTVVDIDDHGVTIEDSEHRPERIPTRTVIWAAGVTASSMARQLGEATGADVDRAGRVSVAARPHAAGTSRGHSRSATWSGCSARTASRSSCWGWRRSRCSRAATWQRL